MPDAPDVVLCSKLCRHNNKSVHDNQSITSTGPLGNSEFCFSRISMFPSTSSRETLRFSGTTIHWGIFPISIPRVLRVVCMYVCVRYEKPRKPWGRGWGRCCVWLFVGVFLPISIFLVLTHFFLTQSCCADAKLHWKKRNGWRQPTVEGE